MMYIHLLSAEATKSRGSLELVYTGGNVIDGAAYLG